MKCITKIIIIICLNIKTYGQVRGVTITSGFITAKSITDNLFLNKLNDQIHYKKYVKRSVAVIGQIKLSKVFKSNNYHVILGYELNSRSFELFNKVKENYTQQSVFIAMEEKMYYKPKGLSNLKVFAIIGLGISFNINNEQLVNYNKRKRVSISPNLHFSFLNLEYKLFKNYAIQMGTGFGYKGLFSVGISKVF
jgi:hypothetical protein